MEQRLNQLIQTCIQSLSECQNLNDLNALKIKVLGKNGELTSFLRGLKDLSPEERPKAGKLINDAREKIEQLINEKEIILNELELKKRLEQESVDITLPAAKLIRGGLHPQTIVRNRIIEIFTSMGYSVEDGPEVETEYYNFEALNIPDDHPAKDMQDTFFITNNFKHNIILRSQTSNTQIRVMEKTKPPIKMINPGRVYRCDDIDATHSPMFHQVEGLVVDKGITMGDLNGTLNAFVKELFGEKTRTRLRPSFFPFTEPSVEADASCPFCDGKGCKICKGAGWIEILGAGMVNPKVLKNCNIDPDVYTGFAFGLGIDRITNILFGITDLRIPFENDIRFLKQFR
ncbi:MAG TPA: phenylalanine--tRNA ligase subunit alpha [Clostridia bacterium]